MSEALSGFDSGHPEARWFRFYGNLRAGIGGFVAYLYYPRVAEVDSGSRARQLRIDSHNSLNDCLDWRENLLNLGGFLSGV